MANESQSSSRVLAYLQLMRLPNVFTAMADVAMGFWLTHETLSPAGEFVCLLVSSSALYTAGIVLNDVCDRRQDELERPLRPIPSGRVIVSTAVSLAIALFVLGIAAALVVGVFAQHWGPLSVAVALVVFIVSYDVHFKHTAGGPLAMGICRMLNVLLGMSMSVVPPSTANSLVACGIGLYIAGITWFARGEAAVSKRFELASALIMMLGGYAVLWWFPRFVPAESLNELIWPQTWSLCWILLAILLVQRCVLGGIIDPQPQDIQSVVKRNLLTLIVMDALIVSVIRGPMIAIGVLALLVPAIVLGWWVYST